ncbi:MAG: GWxTD domain-containing protein, partial [Thermoanaerobaculia bacterium]|nr:GWxTD domain-containing protein [Thermoanaerobaculia bacterium]
MRRLETTPVAVVAVVTLAIGLCWPEAAEARRERMPPRQELLNVLLSPELSQWLVGPIYFIATPSERQQFLRLEDDVAAERFIDAFWRRRDPEPELFGNEVRRLYEERAEEADRRFRERHLHAQPAPVVDRRRLSLMPGPPHAGRPFSPCPGRR